MKLSLASGSSQTRVRERYLRLLDEDCQTTVRILQLFPEEMIRLWLGKGYKSRRTSAHSRANTACSRAASRKPPCSIEKTTLAKCSAASPQAAVPAPSMLYRPVPRCETTCSEPSISTLWVIALV